MKSEALARTTVIDAMASGLAEAARRPLLWILPILVDLVLWLAPRISIGALTERLMAAWKALLPMVYSPEQMAGAQDAMDLLQTGMVELGKAVNLGDTLTAGWMAAPSALTSVQATRYLLVTDAVLAPVSLGLQVKPLGPAAWQPPSIEIGSVLGVVGVIVGLWIVSHLVTALYFRMIARSLPTRASTVAPGALPLSRQPVAEHPGRLFDGWLALAVRLAVVSVFASLIAFLLRLPLVLITTLAVFSGSGALQFLFVLGGGITLWVTLWFLSAMYFVGDGLAFERQPLTASLMHSLLLVRGNGMRVLLLAVVVNLLMLGARAVWGLIGVNPAGAVVAIVANSYLATAMVIGIYIYYQDLRRHWQAAQARRQVSKQ